MSVIAVSFAMMKMTMSGPVPTELIRTLPTPELALHLLSSLAKSPQSSPNSNNLLRGAEHAFAHNEEPDADHLLGRLADAWAWLEAHALIGPHPKNTSSEWQRVTTQGQELAKDPRALAKIWAADRLAGPLDEALEAKVRPIFNLGDYETACFAAMKAVEVAVREAAELDGAVIGVDLMRQAFKVDGGALADGEAHRGERVALMELFAGAIGAFKNPASHRTVHFDDPVEAAEVVQLADLLLRLLRRAQDRSATGQNPTYSPAEWSEAGRRGLTLAPPLLSRPMAFPWAEALNTTAAAAGVTTAAIALQISRRANSTAETVARIERQRWHHDLTPQFDITIEDRQADRASLNVQLRGPISLQRLDEVTVRITTSDDKHRQSNIAGSRPPEEIDAQVWGPYRFTHGADGADINGHAVAPVPLQVGRGRPFAIELTLPPHWWEGDDRMRRWRDEWLNKPVRLLLECRREGFEPWLVPYDVQVPGVPRVRRA